MPGNALDMLVGTHRSFDLGLELRVLGIDFDLVPGSDSEPVEAGDF